MYILAVLWQILIKNDTNAAWGKILQDIEPDMDVGLHAQTIGPFFILLSFFFPIHTTDFAWAWFSEKLQYLLRNVYAPIALSLSLFGL